MERRVVKTKQGSTATQPTEAQPLVRVPVSLAACYCAWLKARRGKKPSANQLAFEGKWLDNLQNLRTALRAGVWQPARTVSFVVSHPKTREIHAPAFQDRVVHHLLVQRLEKLYEPIFIHDSYANRAGKGSHDAVARLQAFMRQRENMPPFMPPLMPQIPDAADIVGMTDFSANAPMRKAPNCSSEPIAFGLSLSKSSTTLRQAQGERVNGLFRINKDAKDAKDAKGAWFLQLDIHNFFNSIHRPTLYAMLVRRLDLAQRSGQVQAKHALALRSLCHKLLAKPAAEHVRSLQAALAVPAHKRLSNAAKGCGVPVGNLTSQFFANVYLNALDQFVKHTLKVRHYVRYVDDFVLLASSREELLAYKASIEAFLQTQLRLTLKTAAVLQPCSYGADFLGYRVFAHHAWVRPRVVRHCHSKLVLWQQRHAKYAAAGSLSPQQFAKLQAVVGSYWGHFGHANSLRLKQGLFLRHPWLADYFVLQANGSLQVNMPARWQVLRRKAVDSFLA
jgi:Reverse transcriptase (RNA-dependent DNA polymerase)